MIEEGTRARLYPLLSEQTFEFVRSDGTCVSHDSLQLAVDRIYASLDVPPPVVVYCESPFQLVYLPILLMILGGTDRFALPELANFLREKENDALFNRLFKRAADQFGELANKNCVLGNLMNVTLAAVFYRAEKLLSESLGPDELARLFHAQLPLTTCFQRLSDVTAQCAGFGPGQPGEFHTLQQPLDKLFQCLPAHVQEDNFHNKCRLFEASNIWWGPWATVPNWVRINNSALLQTRILENSLVVELQGNLGNVRSERFGFNRFQPSVGPCLIASECLTELIGEQDEHTQNWMTLLRGGLAYLFFEKICFVCQRPPMKLDGEIRLHCEDGPAMEFADGQQVHAWHGTIVPATLIQNRGRVTVRSIERERNVELRRVMIELMGIEKYLEKSNAKKIDSDKFGTLYRKEYSVGEPLVVVEVVNATIEPDGSRRRYILRVPPEMRTAREAVAWTFGLRADQYNPAEEA